MVKVTSHDLDILARTIYGEARGETVKGKIAVAWVIRNRVTSKNGQWRRDTDVATACRRPWQFSCWNRNDPNRTKLIVLERSDPMYRKCLEVAALVMIAHSDDEDPTGGAHHYHTKALGFPKTWGEPKKPDVTIGNHHFYRGIA